MLHNLTVERKPRPLTMTDFYRYEIVKAPGKKIGIITGDIQNVKKWMFGSFLKTPISRCPGAMSAPSLAQYDIWAPKRMVPNV
jgi:hypothetical protein